MGNIIDYKVLSGFANRYSEHIDLNSSAGRMMAYYNRINEIESPLPYTFGEQKGLEQKIIFHESWIKMIQDNMVAKMINIIRMPRQGERTTECVVKSRAELGIVRQS